MHRNVRKYGLVNSLVAAAERISCFGELDDLLHAVLVDARSLTRAGGACLWIRQGENLSCHVLQAGPPPPSSWASRLGQLQPIDSRSPAGLAGLSGLPLWIDSTRVPAGAEFASPIGHDLLSGYAVENYLAIPLGDEGEDVLGVLELVNTGLAFSGHPGQERRATTLADQLVSLMRICSVAMRNAMLREDMRHMQQETVHRLSHAVEFCDENMHDHIRRMSRTVGILARTMGLESQLSEGIEYAAPMHDIGKLGVPEAILRLPRRLTVNERKILETHAHLGGELLDSSGNKVLRLARQMALTHHERWDGHGYPNRLCGDQIPISGRICALADVFDALVSRRAYKRPYPIPAAVGIVQSERGRHFDPTIVEAFTGCLREIMALYNHPIVRGVVA